jgi:NitT/TauT family transport system ATP-binding protein
MSEEAPNRSHSLTRGEVVVRNVSKAYGPERFATQVIRDCCFVAPAQKFTAIIGPSGVGKSTLIRLIAGFERPTGGEILLDGRPVTGPGRDRLVVFQETALFPWMTTDENVMFGPLARGDVSDASAKFADFLIDKVGLRVFRKRFPSQLSGGMQRRAELARALINNPDVMILDEPFRGLDAMTRRLMLEYYAALSQEQPRTNLFVSTDVDEAIFVADRLLVMSHIPTRVRAEIEVDLPRPRRFSALFKDNRANALKMEALSLLHEEAMKGFSGRRAAATDFIEAYRRRVASG